MIVLLMPQVIGSHIGCSGGGAAVGEGSGGAATVLYESSPYEVMSRGAPGGRCGGAPHAAAEPGGTRSRRPARAALRHPAVSAPED